MNSKLITTFREINALISDVVKIATLVIFKLLCELIELEAV